MKIRPVLVFLSLLAVFPFPPADKCIISLSVFAKRKRLKLISSTAVIGVRGTAVYVESEPERAYVCTCYGSVDLTPNAAPETTETIITKYHDAPRFAYPAGSPRLIAEAPVFNHTDAELVMLEEMAGRKPPFVKSGFSGYWLF